MLVRIKCIRCAKTLELDPAFAGMRCRCRHCRALQDVPNTPVVNSSAPAMRPLHPPSAEAGRRRMPAAVAVVRSRSPMAHRRRLYAGIGAALATSLALVIGFQRSRSTRPDPIMEVADAEAAAEITKRQGEIAAAIAEVPKSQSGLAFVEIPAEGRSVALVIDGDSAMSDGRLDEVSLIAFNFASNVLESGGTMWLGLPGETEPAVFEARDGSSASINGVRAGMFSRFARGHTNLVSAVQAAAAQRTDEFFLVFARRLSPRMIEVVSQAIQQSGATTHVVAMGEAARQDLSALVAGTRGSIRPLLDEDLHRISQAYRPVVAPKPRGD